MKWVPLVAMLIIACDRAVPSSSPAIVTVAARHCVVEMVATYQRRGAPDSVMVEAWALDSAGRRILYRSDAGPLHFYEGWWYGSQVESFSWEHGPSCDRTAFIP